MHWTRPPLLGSLESSWLDLRVAGNAAVDLSPLNVATMLVWTGAAARAVAAAEETIIDEAIAYALVASPTLQWALPEYN